MSLVVFEILARGYRSRVLAINSEQVTNPPKIKKLSERAQAYRISDMASYKDSLQVNLGGLHVSSKNNRQKLVFWSYLTSHNVIFCPEYKIFCLHLKEDMLIGW